MSGTRRSLGRRMRLAASLLFLLGLAVWLFMVLVPAVGILRILYNMKLGSESFVTGQAPGMIQLEPAGPMKEPTVMFSGRLLDPSFSPWNVGMVSAVGRFTDRATMEVAMVGTRGTTFYHAGGGTPWSVPSPALPMVSMGMAAPISAVSDGELDDLINFSTALERVSYSGHRVWSLDPPEPLATGLMPIPHVVREQPDGTHRVVVLGMGLPSVWIVDATTGQLIATIPRTRGTMGTIAHGSEGTPDRVALLSHMGTRLTLYSLDGEEVVRYPLDVPDNGAMGIRMVPRSTGGYRMMVFGYSSTQPYHYDLPDPGSWDGGAIAPVLDPDNETQLATLDGKRVPHVHPYNSGEMPIIPAGRFGHFTMLQSQIGVLFTADGEQVQWLSIANAGPTMGWAGNPHYDAETESILLPMGLMNPGMVTVLRIPLRD